MRDTGWTQPYCQVTHRVHNNIQYSLTVGKKVTTGFIYDWTVYRTLRRDLLFLGPDHEQRAKAWIEAVIENKQHYTAEDDDPHYERLVGYGELSRCLHHAGTIDEYLCLYHSFLYGHGIVSS